jgi:hypothetical protein
MKALVEDPNTLIGQYLRHIESARIYRITGVEKIGASVVEVEGMHLPALAVQEADLFTWTLIRAKYSILVQADDIGGIGFDS